jgi:hypothetical protein
VTRLLVIALALGLWALMAPTAAEAQAAQWPFRSKLELRECGTGRVFSPTDPFYKEVAPKVATAFTTGLSCLKSNPNTPNRAAKLNDLLQSGQTIRIFFHCSADDMNDPSNDACGASRASPFAGQLVQFHDRALKPDGPCGCLEATVFHEFIHVTSSSAECPAYRCAKDCFACARPVPTEVNGENCTSYKTCCDLGRVCCAP